MVTQQMASQIPVLGANTTAVSVTAPTTGRTQPVANNVSSASLRGKKRSVSPAASAAQQVGGNNNKKKKGQVVSATPTQAQVTIVHVRSYIKTHIQPSVSH